MLRLPSRFATLILSFAPLFFQRSWHHAEVLLVGGHPGTRQASVTSLLRISGLARKRRFVNYHRVLNRAVGSPRAASRLLLGRLVAAFALVGPVVLGIDDTIERRRGKRIAAKGIYRDPVRSSHEVLRNVDTPWLPLTVQGWYGEGERTVEVCSATAVWRHGGMPVVPIRWVLVRDPQHRFEPQPCYAPTSAARPSRSWAGSSSAGNSR